MKFLVVLFALVAVAVAAPYHALAYAVPAAVSHQSRVDYRSSPVVVASAPVVSYEPVVARTVVAPAVIGASAVSHQSRVDVHSSPAVVATAPVISAPVVAARSVYGGVPVAYYGGAPALYSAW